MALELFVCSDVCQLLTVGYMFQYYGVAFTEFTGIEVMGILTIRKNIRLPCTSSAISLVTCYEYACSDSDVLRLDLKIFELQSAGVSFSSDRIMHLQYLF